jgi:hypothetical protein
LAIVDLLLLKSFQQRPANTAELIEFDARGWREVRALLPLWDSRPERDTPRIAEHIVDV